MDTEDESITAGRSASPRDAGFTLIELMVVVVIIAVLVAISLPSFIGASRRANERTAQTTVRTTVFNARSIAIDTGDYTGVNMAVLQAAERSLKVRDENTSVRIPPEVSFLVVGEYTLYAASTNGTNRCFYARDIVAGPDAGTAFAIAETADCKAADAVGLAESAWKISWFRDA